MSSRSTLSGGAGVGVGTLGQAQEFQVDGICVENGVPIVRATIGDQGVRVIDPDDLLGFTSEMPESTQKRRNRRMQAILSDYR